jgi:flagellar biosynthesis protein FlhA
LGRGIIRKYLTSENSLTVTNLDRAVEDLIVAALQHHEDGTTTLNLDPELAQRLLNNIAQTMRNFESTGSMPILVCGSRVRWDLRKLINRFIPGLVVLAFDEIPSDIQTRSVGLVTL